MKTNVKPIAPLRETPILVQFLGRRYPPMIRYSSGKFTPDGRALFCYPGPVDTGDDGLAFVDCKY